MRPSFRRVTVIAALMLGLATSPVGYAGPAQRRGSAPAKTTAEPVAAAQPTAAPAPRTLHFAVVADVDGDFAAFDCRTGGRHALPVLAASIRARAAALAAEGHSLRTIVPGDFLGAAPAARHLLTETKDGASRIAAALAAMRTLVHGVGNGELVLPVGAFEGYLAALRKEGITTGSVNLGCDASRTVVCGDGEAQAAWTMTKLDGVAVGAFALQYDDFDGKVDKRHLAGLRFLEPAPATIRALERLDVAGAKLRVGVVHRGRHGSPEEELTQMAEALNGWTDLIISDAVPEGAELSRVLRVGHGEKAVTVVSVPGGAWAWHEVQVDVDADGRVLVARVVPHSLGESDAGDPALTAWLDGARTSFCRRWGAAVGKLQLATPYDEADFVWLVLYIMRQVAGTDISVINQGAFDLGSGFPLKKTIARADLYRILRFPNHLVRMRVSGADLAEMVDADPGSDAGKKDLHWVGVDVRDGDVYVNGRLLDRRLNYTVVLNDFLAHGGDGTFDGIAPGERLEGRRDRMLREHVEAWLVARGTEPLGSPAAAFPDLWDQPMWTLAVAGKLDFTSLGFGNRAGYVDPRLNNLRFSQFDAAIDANARLNTRDHGWTGRVVMQFTEITSEGVDYVNADVIRGETSYEFRRLRDTWLERARWAPILTAYGRARTEFDVPTTQPYRFFDVDGLLGAAWELMPGLQIRAGAGANIELLRVNPGPYPRSMVHMGVVLERYPVLTVGQSELFLQLEADVRGKGLRSDQRWTVFLDGTVLARLFGPLMVYAQCQWFGMRADGPQQDFTVPGQAGTWSTQTRVSAGLALSAIGALQAH